LPDPRHRLVFRTCYGNGKNGRKEYRQYRNQGKLQGGGPFYLKRSSNADFADTEASWDFFSPADVALKSGLSENQSQKFALSGSEGISA
jgi:hypothetical protein